MRRGHSRRRRPVWGRARARLRAGGADSAILHPDGGGDCAQAWQKLYVFLCEEDFPYDQESPAESDRNASSSGRIGSRLPGRESCTPLSAAARILLSKCASSSSSWKSSREPSPATALELLPCSPDCSSPSRVISTGVWWWVAHGPQATAEKVAGQFRYDRSRMREQLATEIGAQAQKRIASTQSDRGLANDQ